MIQGFNKNVACEPLQVEEDTGKGNVTVGKMHVKVLSQRQQLVSLKVIFGSEEYDIEPGDFVYVTQAGQHQVGMTSQWTKSIDIELGGGEKRAVVMVPLDQVQLVDRKRATRADIPGY